MTKKEWDKIESKTFIGNLKKIKQEQYQYHLSAIISKVLFNMKIVRILFRLK